MRVFAPNLVVGAQGGLLFGALCRRADGMDRSDRPIAPPASRYSGPPARPAAPCRGAARAADGGGGPSESVSHCALSPV